MRLQCCYFLRRACAPRARSASSWPCCGWWPSLPSSSGVAFSRKQSTGMRRAVRDEPLSAGCAPAVARVAPTLAERLCCASARRAGTCPCTTQSPGPTSGTNSPPACSLRTLESELSSMHAGSIVSVSAQVKACELDAVIVAGNRFEDIRRDRRLRICFGVRADWWDSLAPTSEGLCRGV